MNDPFWRLPIVSTFDVTSADVADGQELPVAQMSGIFGSPVARMSRRTSLGREPHQRPGATP